MCLIFLKNKHNSELNSMFEINFNLTCGFVLKNIAAPSRIVS